MEDRRCGGGAGDVGIIGNKSKQPPVLIKKSLAEYFNERIAERVMAEEGKFDRDDIYYTPAWEVAEARHEITCLDRKLVQSRGLWLEEKKVLVERWKDAVDRQAAIFDRLPQLNPYFKETFGKRERAFRTTAREREQCLEKDTELRRQQKELAKLIEVKAQIEHRFDEFSIYKDYLESTKEASHGEYPDVKNLIDRYGILADAREDLMNRNTSFRDTVAKKQRALDDDILMRSNEVLAYRNYLSELMEYDTILQEQVFRLNDSLLRIKTTAAQRTLVIGQIKMAIRNLYLQVCKSLHRYPKVASEDTLGQLNDVKHSIREMSRLTSDIHRMLKAARVTAKKEAMSRVKLAVLATERLKRIDKFIPITKKPMDVRELFGLPPIKPKLPPISKILLTRTNN